MQLFSITGLFWQGFFLNSLKAQLSFVGKICPKLNVTHWIRPINESRNPKLTVIEFWATWCASSTAVIPHMNQLVDKFGDTVNFISLSNEKKQKVQHFLKNSEIKSAIAIDRSLTTNNNFEISYIPQTFIVNEAGIVIWQGNSKGLTDSVLTAAIHGNLPASL